MFGQKIIFYLLLGVIALMRITPFFIIYIISDFMYIILYHIVSYRKDVVISNLEKVFTDKSSEEIKTISKQFYKNLADIFVESVKGFAMNEKQMQKRFKTENPEVANKYFEQNKDVIALGSHYANWEWGAASCGIQFKHQTAVLYKPLSNKFFDAYIKKKRARFGVKLVPINKTHRYVVSKKPKPAVYVMVTDQHPSNSRKAIWVDFLNQKTAFLHGAERYAKGLNIPVIYFDIQRIKRGYYSMKVIDIAKDYKDIEEEGLTKIYAGILEKIIMEKPQDWLWSHKRWKHKPPDDI